MSIEKTYRQVAEEVMPEILAEAMDKSQYPGGAVEHKHASAGAAAVVCSLGRALARAGHYEDEYEAFTALGLPAGFIEFLRKQDVGNDCN